MPAERTTMRQVREVLRLKFVGGVPTREIARRIGVVPSTVRTTIKTAPGANLRCGDGRLEFYLRRGDLDADARRLDRRPHARPCSHTSLPSKLKSGRRRRKFRKEICMNWESVMPAPHDAANPFAMLGRGLGLSPLYIQVGRIFAFRDSQRRQHIL